MSFTVTRTGLSLAIGVLISSMSASVCWAQTPADRKEAIHRCLLQIYLSQRKPEAGGEYDAILALKPNDAPMHYDYGNYLTRGGQIGKAVAQYKKAVAIEPRHAEYLSALGSVLLSEKQFDGAVDAFRKAVETGGQNYVNKLNQAIQYQQQAKQYQQYTKQQKEQAE